MRSLCPTGLAIVVLLTMGNVAQAAPPAAEPSAFPLLELLKQVSALHAEDRAREQRETPSLIQALKDKDARVREKAAERLSQLHMPGEEMIGPLIDALRDPIPVVRSAAISTLRKIGPMARTALPTVLQLAREDPDPSVRRHAVEALVPLGTIENFQTYVLQGLLGLFDVAGRDSGTDRLEPTQVTPLCPEVIPTLLQALGDAEEIRDAALRELPAIGPQSNEVIPAILPILADPRPIGRAQAARALGVIGPRAKRAVPELRKLLLDMSAVVRAEAAMALWKIDGQAHVVAPVLADVLGEQIEDDDLFVATLKALPSESEEGRVKVTSPTGAADGRFLKGLFGMFGDERRSRVLRILRSIGPEAKVAVPAVLPSLKANSSRLRLEAARTLWKLDRRSEELMPILTAALQDSHPIFGTANQALALLVEMGPEAKPALPALLRFIQEEDDGILHDLNLNLAVHALGAIGPEAKSALPFLTRLVQRKPRSSEVVAEAVAKISGPWGPDIERQK